MRYLPSHEGIEILAVDGDRDTVGRRHVAHNPEKREDGRIGEGGSTDWGGLPGEIIGWARRYQHLTTATVNCDRAASLEARNCPQ